MGQAVLTAAQNEVIRLVAKEPRLTEFYYLPANTPRLAAGMKRNADNKPRRRRGEAPDTAGLRPRSFIFGPRIEFIY